MTDVLETFIAAQKAAKEELGERACSLANKSDPKFFAETIRQGQLVLGLSNRDIGRAGHRHDSTVERWKQGRQRGLPSEILRVCELIADKCGKNLSIDLYPLFLLPNTVAGALLREDPPELPPEILISDLVPSLLRDMAYDAANIPDKYTFRKTLLAGIEYFSLSDKQVANVLGRASARDIPHVKKLIDITSTPERKRFLQFLKENLPRA